MWEPAAGWRGSPAGSGRGKGAARAVATGAASPGRGSGAWPCGGPACAHLWIRTLRAGLWGSDRLEPRAGVPQQGSGCMRNPAPCPGGHGSCLAHLSPSGVEVRSLSAAGQGWRRPIPRPAAGSQEPEALSELAVTLQGQKGQQDRVVRRGLDGHGWVAAAPTAAQLQGGGLRGSARKVALPLSGLCLHCSCH